MPQRSRGAGEKKVHVLWPLALVLLRVHAPHLEPDQGRLEHYLAGSVQASPEQGSQEAQVPHGHTHVVQLSGQVQIIADTERGGWEGWGGTGEKGQQGNGEGT